MPYCIVAFRLGMGRVLYNSAVRHTRTNATLRDSANCIIEEQMMNTGKRKLSLRMSYSFDNFMAKGTIAYVGALLLMTIGFVIIASAIMVIPNPAEGDASGFVGTSLHNFFSALGTVFNYGESLWIFVGTLIMAIGTMFITSALVGVISNALSEKIASLRKGRSSVIENDHIVILGWSPKIFYVLTELAIANSSKKGTAIVILGDLDKVSMEEEVRANVANLYGVRVVCRTGSPTDMEALKIVSLDTARSIVIIGNDNDNNDIEVIKILLAVVNCPDRPRDSCSIIAKIRHENNQDVAYIASNKRATLVVADTFISRIAAQSCYQFGLSLVYADLLRFSGSEIYFKTEPNLVGKTFGESLLKYKNSSVLGIALANGKTRLLPPFDLRISAGDSMILLAEDDSLIETISDSDTSTLVDTAAISQTVINRSPEVGRTLLLGWNRRAANLIRELDTYVGPGSELHILSRLGNEAYEADLLKIISSEKIKNLTVTSSHGDHTDRKELENNNPASYDHIVVLASDGEDVQKADANTMVTLLHLRDISKISDKGFSIVSEMLDVRNRDLAEVTQPDDFVIGDQLICFIMAQLSENMHLSPVFQDLFDAGGCELYLKPVSDYLLPGRPVNFYTVVEAASQRGEVAVGYRLIQFANDKANAYGVRINPDKSATVDFSEHDKLIVLAN